jgi:hypothetical protein
MELAADEDDKVVQFTKGKRYDLSVSSHEKKSNDVYDDHDTMPCILYAQRYLSSNTPHPNANYSSIFCSHRHL